LSLSISSTGQAERKAIAYNFRHSWSQDQLWQEQFNTGMKVLFEIVSELVRMGCKNLIQLLACNFHSYKY